MDDVKSLEVRAADIIWDTFNALAGRQTWTRKAAESLSDAGLLRTELHERALEACKGWANHPVCHNVDAYERCDFFKLAAQVGREALEAEKPKDGPWLVKEYQPQAFGVFNGEAATIPRGTWNTEAEAKAVAKALNELPR